MSANVLVVDDDPDLRAVLVDVLEDEGYTVRAAEHGRAALDLLHAADTLPDVILLDVMMPVMNGLAFATEVRNDPRLSELPIVVFSAHSDHQRIADVVRAAASMAKPLKLDELLAVVAAVARAGRGRTPSPPPRRGS